MGFMSEGLPQVPFATHLRGNHLVAFMALSLLLSAPPAFAALAASALKADLHTSLPASALRKISKAFGSH